MRLVESMTAGRKGAAGAAGALAWRGGLDGPVPGFPRSAASSS